MAGAIRRAGVIVALVAGSAFLLQSAFAQSTPIVKVGDVVVSGFSGTVAPDPSAPLPAGKLPVDLTFIDVAGHSARILDVSGAGAAWDAHVVTPGDVLDVSAADVGQVFGVALDDAAAPNVYLAATSAFGLNIVVPGRGANPPERTEVGRLRAVWMDGQFGLDLSGGPGSIWKVDGVTGEVSLFANVTLNGVPNPGPALGSLAYDPVHRQLFVSDRYTGMIHRFGMDGADLGHFDHGVDGRAAAGLSTIPFDPSVRLDITSSSFNSSDPTTWGYAPPERQVWGLAVHDGRLYYSVADGPQIWSIGIAPDGSFAGDPRWELDVPAEDAAFPVSDITFSEAGAMIFAERAPVTGSYDYSAFTLPAAPRVLVYWLENPDDPATPSRWMPAPEEYAVGFPDDSRNTDGGVDLGYAYGPDGHLDVEACGGALWTTGDKLRDDPALAPQLQPGGPLLVDGLQTNPADQVRNANTPPWQSYYVDYDDRFDDALAVGHMGTVRILKAPCAGAVAGGYGGPPYVPNPPLTGGGGECRGTNPDGSCANIWVIDLAIKKTTGAVSYDAGTGTWTVDFKIEVTNNGAAFFPGGLISISDPVPSGFTITGATGTNWSCLPPPPLSSGSLNCAYNYGAGLFNTGDSLNQLIVTATTSTPGKYENCATVQTPAGSGLYEPNLTNNTACADVVITPQTLACFESKGEFVCDPKTGQWVYQLSVSGPSWLDTVTALSLTAGATVPGGPISLDPAHIPVTGPAGSTAIIEVCGFNAADAKSGKPYDCCRTQVKVTIPDGKCEVQP